MSYRERIAEAVDDDDWQTFRVSLKGHTTRVKIDMLRNYYVSGVTTREFEAVELRVDNYLKALCRGGQLYPGCDLAAMIKSEWSSRWIKRG